MLHAFPRSPRRLAILNARLLDPETGLDAAGGLLVRGDTIEAVGSDVTLDQIDDSDVLDARGQCLSPGFIDTRVTTGEPGADYRETLETAARSAAAGGVTTMCVLPDTDPVIDTPALVDFIARRGRDTGMVRVLPVGALTQGLAGEALAPIGLMREAGAAFVSNARAPVRNAQVLRRALTYARAHGLVVDHMPLDLDLSGEGVMNEGEASTRLGLPGSPREAEAICVARDIALARLTGASLNLANLTCAASVTLIREAKREGLDVTASASINHLSLNENDIGEYRTFFKLTPPLRHEDDRLALVDALTDGTIDLLTSDHDPQDADTKRLPFAEAASGAVGLETMLSAGLRLVEDGLPLLRLVDALTGAARRLKLPQGRLAKGAPADLALFDAGAPYVLAARDLRSRSKNTPFDGARLQGRVTRCFVAGRAVFERG